MKQWCHISIKLYLQKQAVDGSWPKDCCVWAISRSSSRHPQRYTQYGVSLEILLSPPDFFNFWERVSLFHNGKLECVTGSCLCFLFHLGGITVSVVAFFFTIKFLFELAARVVSFLQNEDRERRGDRTIYDYVRGNYLDPRSCKVSWDWKDPYEVGHSMAFRVHVRECFCLPYPLGFLSHLLSRAQFSLLVALAWKVNIFSCFSVPPRNLGIVNIGRATNSFIILV